MPKYSHYLCFSVSVRTNKFALKHLDRYSPEQEEVLQKIKSLHESGLGYRKIAHHLSKWTYYSQGKKWGGNRNIQFSREAERQARLEHSLSLLK